MPFEQYLSIVNGCIRLASKTNNAMYLQSMVYNQMAQLLDGTLPSNPRLHKCLQLPSFSSNFPIVGFIYYYTLMQLSMWWFFHIITLFWKIRFPFHARSFENVHGFKHLHITAVILGVVLPLIPSTSMIATGGFVIGRFPPVVCQPSDLATAFYSVEVPIIVMVQIGISLLVIIFWTIHKV